MKRKAQQAAFPGRVDDPRDIEKYRSGRGTRVIGEYPDIALFLADEPAGVVARCLPVYLRLLKRQVGEDPVDRNIGRTAAARWWWWRDRAAPVAATASRNYKYKKPNYPSAQAHDPVLHFPGVCPSPIVPTLSRTCRSNRPILRTCRKIAPFSTRHRNLSIAST